MAQDHGTCTITVLRTGATYKVTAITRYPSGNYRSFPSKLDIASRTQALWAMRLWAKELRS